MAYIKTTWEDGATALSAAHFNNMEEGIEANDTAISELETAVDNLEDNTYTKSEVYSKGETYSKSEIYSKGDFVILEGTVTGVKSGDTKSVSWTLQQLGVSRIQDIVPISVWQSTEGQPRYGNTFSTKLSGMTTYNNVYPMVMRSGSSLSLEVFNGSESSSGTANIPYQLVLLKIR